ncbi:MAG: DHH family phosphoesterase [Thermoplasmata archaeon]
MGLPEGKKTLFLSHQNADPDAVGCLYFLQSRYRGDIGLPDEPDKRGKRLADYLEMEYTICPSPEEYEQIVVVDTPDPKQLEPIPIVEEKTTVIDHHRANLWAGWDVEMIYEDRGSCAEIIYEMVKPRDMTEKEVFALTAGILTDTSYLNRADEGTFRILSELFSRSEITISQVKRELFKKRTYSEKICRLKGAKRSSFQKVNGYLIAYTKVNSFESSACDILLKAGADVAFTVSERDDGIIISGRTRDSMLELGMDLGAIMKVVSSAKESASGGGHPGAAVFKGNCNSEQILRELLAKVTEEIKKNGWYRRKD